MSVISDVSKKQKADRIANAKEVEKLTLNKADVETLVRILSIFKISWT
jgi:hypothetical protein